MNYIKRNIKFRNDNLLCYKYGTKGNQLSEKILLNSKVNKRIVLDKFLLHNILYFVFPIKSFKFLLTKTKLNLRDSSGNTPLHISLEFGKSVELIKLLITEKNVEFPNSNGELPVKLALDKRFPDEIIELLIPKKILNNSLHKLASDRGYSTKILKLLKKMNIYL